MIGRWARLSLTALLLTSCAGSASTDSGATLDADLRDAGAGAADTATPAPDATASDAAPADTSARDAAAADATTADTAPLDAGAPLDTGAPFDAGAPLDTGAAFDSGVPPDAGQPACVPTSTVGVRTSSVPAMRLSETGLYTVTASKALAPRVETFQPKYALWSDGAVKTRWVLLPECAQIDTSSMDRWSMPVGAKFWKEFVVAGRRIETRLIERWGPGPADFTFSAYQWDAQERDAVRVPLGVINASGTPHDIPSESNCVTCHANLTERILGFGAIQLSHPGPGLTIAELSRRGLLTVPAPNGFAIPGSSTVSAALGYLHANCGNCHNATPNAVPFVNRFDLRVSVNASRVEDTGAYTTAVGVPLERFVYPGVTHRVRAGQRAASAVFVRMSSRGMPLVQMPPLGTEVVDPTGRDTLGRWIDGL